MLKAKTFIIVGILISSFAAPAAASSSTGHSSDQSRFQWFFNSFRSSDYEYKGLDYKDYSKVIEWYNAWKENCPTEESIDIWRKWYCS